MSNNNTMSNDTKITDTIGLLNALEQRTVTADDLDAYILDMALYEWFTFDKALLLQDILTDDPAKHAGSWCGGLAWDMNMVDDMLNDFGREGEEWLIRKTTIRDYLARIEACERKKGE